MNDQKWIVSDKDYLGGKPRVQGTRISIAADLVENDVALGFNPGETLDVGIAVVMPSTYAINMLTHPTLQRMREDHVRMREETNEPLNDSVRMET